MTLVQTYAHQCGVKVSAEAPNFPTNFFPLPEKYITISPKNGQQAKDYPYFHIVVSILASYLGKQNIAFLQLGVRGEQHIPGCYKPDLSLRQTAHAIKNSLCHVSVDTMTAHLAGIFKTPIVEIFGSTNANSARPHYLGKHIFLKGYKDLPSYQAEEHNPAIRNVKPEEVAQAVLDMLEINEKIQIKTEFIGGGFGHKTIDLIPNFEPDYDKLQGNLNVRMDQVHNEKVLLDLVRARREPFILTLSKPLSDNFPDNKFKEIYYFIKEDYKKEDILSLSKWGGRVTFVYKGPREKIQEVRLDLGSPYDMNFIGLPMICDVKVDKECVFNTHRVFLSGGNVYGSLAHLKMGVPGTNSVAIGKVGQNQEFLESLNNYHIYSKT